MYTQSAQGVFNGTGADLFIGCGFVPDLVIVRAIGGANAPSLHWSINDRVAAMSAGFLDTDGATGLVRQTAGTGIEIYEGGEVLTVAMQPIVTYGEGTYLARDTKDYRKKVATQPYEDVGDAVAVDIDRWVLDTAGTRKGHFNADVVGSYIGAGSVVLFQTGDGRIRFKRAYIEALTAGQGSATDEVTLDRALPTANVYKIMGKFDYVPQVVGTQTLAGFKIDMATPVNVNDELQMFEAYQFSEAPA